MLLRQHYGISAREYLHVLPGWEVDLLLAALPTEGGLADESDAPEAPVVRDPRVPSSFYGDE